MMKIRHIAIGLLMGIVMMGLCGCQEDLKKADNITIKLIPYDNFSQKEATQLAQEIEEHMTPLLGDRTLDVEVMPNRKMPKEFKSVGHNRYRADSVIHSLQRVKEQNTIKIALTHHDISTTTHGVKDFGILGLSFTPGNSCVVSTYRVAQKQYFWKVTVHEALHAMGLHHCPNDDPHCLMKDAKGKPHLELQQGLCPTCDSLLNK